MIPDDEMKKNEMRHGPEHRPAKLGCKLGGNTPRCEKLGVKEYAAGQPRNPQNIR